MRESEDNRLVAEARRGSRDARRTLFETHWRHVWRSAYAVTGRREAADDIAQEAFVRAFETLDRFDSVRPFGPWIKRIAVNAAIDELRRRRLLTEGAAPEDEPAWFADANTSVAVVRAVRSLSPGKRACVALYYWLDYSIEEIAELTGLPEGTVMSRLGRARDELRTYLEAIDVE